MGGAIGLEEVPFVGKKKRETGAMVVLFRPLFHRSRTKGGQFRLVEIEPRKDRRKWEGRLGIKTKPRVSLVPDRRATVLLTVISSVGTLRSTITFVSLIDGTKGRRPDPDLSEN